MVPFLTIGTSEGSTINLLGPMKQSCPRQSVMMRVVNNHTCCAKEGLFLATCCLEWSMDQASARYEVADVLESAKLQGLQPGCPAFLEAHSLLNSFKALITSGTPTGPSNGR